MFLLQTKRKKKSAASASTRRKRRRRKRKKRDVSEVRVINALSWKTKALLPESERGSGSDEEEVQYVYEYPDGRREVISAKQLREVR